MITYGTIGGYGCEWNDTEFINRIINEFDDHHVAHQMVQQLHDILKNKI